MKLRWMSVAVVVVVLLLVQIATACMIPFELGLWGLVQRSDAIAIVRVTEVRRIPIINELRAREVMAGAGSLLARWVERVSPEAALLVEAAAEGMAPGVPIIEPYRAEVEVEAVLVGSLRESEEVILELGVPFLSGDRMMVFLQRDGRRLHAWYADSAVSLRSSQDVEDLAAAVESARALMDSGGEGPAPTSWLVEAAVLPAARPLVAEDLASQARENGEAGTVGNGEPGMLSQEQSARLASALLARPRLDRSLPRLLQVLADHRHVELDHFAAAVTIALEQADREPALFTFRSLACAVLARFGQSNDCHLSVHGDPTRRAWAAFRAEQGALLETEAARTLVQRELDWQDQWIERLQQQYR